MIKQPKPGESHRQLVTTVKVKHGVPTVIRVSGREYVLRQQGEIERLKSELAEKDKVLLDIKYQIEQSNHPAGISVLSSINYILSQYKKGDTKDEKST